MTNVYMMHFNFLQAMNYFMSNQMAPYDSVIDFCEDDVKSRRGNGSLCSIESCALHVAFDIMIRGH